MATKSLTVKKPVKRWDLLTPKQKVTRWSHAVRAFKNQTDHEIDKHLNMGIWGQVTPCGTVCCAAGRCGLDPAIRKQGFRLNISGFAEKWSVSPHIFYGMYAYSNIFVNRSYVQLRGRKAYNVVLKAMENYLEELKGEV